MPKLLEKDPTLIFNIVGSNPTEEVLALNSDNVKVLGYVSDEELCALYSKNRVVVAPLRFGAGVKGKIIEAMAHGVPVVTTNVGAEGIVGLTDDSLFIADEAEDYVKAVEKVYLDKEVFEKAKNSSLNLVKDFYSTEKARGIFKELFSKEIS